MVSKLNSVFRHIIGSDNQHPATGSRKRPSESLEDVEEDVLATPQAKRARIGNQPDGNPGPTTPLLKVASWIRRKASSFGETYFFKPVGDFVERSYPSPLPIPEPIEERNHRQPRVMSDDASQRRPIPRDGNPNKNSNTPTRVSFKQPGEPCARKTLSSNQHQSVLKQPAAASSNGPHGSSNSTQRSGGNHLQRAGSGAEARGRPPNVSKPPMPVASNSSAAAPNRSKHKGYVPVREKLFPDPRRRVVVPHVPPMHTSLHNSKLAINECVRLKERQQYQQLLEQYTKGFPMGQTSTRIQAETASKTKDSAALAMGARPKTYAEASATNLEQPSVLQQKSQDQSQQQELGTRVLPHQFSTRTEVREAVRQRLHAPASQLSPGTPSTERNKPAATPAQPDFNDLSPILMSVQSPPAVSAFQKSLVSTPYLGEDWVKDLKAHFESSVRIRKREIEEHESKFKHFEERRAKGQVEAQEQIKARISKAERLPGVIEDTIYKPEEKEEEDEIEIIDSDEDEEEEEYGDEDEEEEDEGPEMTEEMDLKIDHALHPNPSSQVLVSGFRLNITRRDMQTLAGLNWLNDEIMNFYFEMLKARSEQEGYPSVHVFNTFFYPKLLNSGYASIRRWTKKVDIFTKEVLLAPIHLGMHWCLAVIDFRHKTVVFYDSMGSHNQQCLDTLRDYVVSEYADKKKGTYSMDGWRCFSARDIPKQMNGSDCGVFACKYAEYVSRDAPITFTQLNMPYFRRRMVWEILHMKLL